MTDDNRDDVALDALFAKARSNPAQPSDDFMARLRLDAENNLPKPAPASPRLRSFDWLPGFFTASGLSGAALAGVWIGFAMPDALDNLSFGTDTSVALSTFLPSADLGAVFDE